MAAKFHVDICFSPSLYPCYARKGNLVVLIDIFRATTVICKALCEGAKSIIPVPATEEALKYKGADFLIAGERDGYQLNGFDMGNSPYDFDKKRVKDRKIVLTTTNGVQAISAVNDSSPLYFGAYANFSVLSRFIMLKKCDVLLLCSGWKNKMNIEDSLFAGELAQNLINSGKYYTRGDSAGIAMALCNEAGNRKLYFILGNSPRLRGKVDILGNDMRYALKYDTCPVIPVYQNNQIVKKIHEACL